MKLDRRWKAAAAGGGIVLAVASCQAIAGLDDRSEAPAAAPTIDASSLGGASGAGGSSSGHAGASGGSGKSGAAGHAGSAGSGGSAGSAGFAGSKDAGSDADASDGMAPTCMATMTNPDAGITAPPPESTATGKPSGAPSVAFAVHDFHFGAVDINSKAASPTAWKDIGLDLDGLCSANPDGGAPQGSCQPVQPTPDLLDDGNQCRDNNFGKFFASFTLNAGATFESNVNQRVAGGETTFGLVIDDLDSSPCDDYAPGRGYVLAPAGGINGIDGGPAPDWVGTDVRVVDERSVVPDGGVKDARATFPHGYVRNDVWVSGPLENSATELYLPLGPYVIDMSVDALQIVAQLTPDHMGIQSATIAAVISPEELTTSLDETASLYLGCLASGLVDETIAQIVTYNDLSSGAPDFQNPQKTCDRMSMALGLELRRIQPLTQTTLVPLLANPCDAGAMDGSAGASGAAGAAGASGKAGQGGG